MKRKNNQTKNKINKLIIVHLWVKLDREDSKRQIQVICSCFVYSFKSHCPKNINS